MDMYGELAEWWPLISPPADYEEEAGFVASLLAAHRPEVVEVLELGSGGGHNAFHLRRSFTMTLVDLSPDMLAMSRRLNPDCTHHVGDMRTVRLGCTFDAVFLHDALAYMTTEADLQAAAHTAFAHCRPGGLAVLEPDDTAETFVPYTDHGGTDGPDGRSVRYLEWVWDPDPDDTALRGEFVFALREADGTVRTVHDTHHWGVFPRSVWLDVLAVAGFEAEAVTEVTTEDREPRELFLGRRPR